MGIRIDVLNVGNGDAIFVTLTRKEETLLMMIDGGNKGHAKHVLSRLDEKCKELKKGAPDLVICTHYDSDHIGGLIEVVKKYKNAIKRIGLHYTPGVWQKQVLNEAEQDPPLLSPAYQVKQHLINFDKGVVNRQKLYETLAQSEELCDLVKQFRIEYFEPYAGTEVFRGWPEIRILGPTKPFYKNLLEQLEFPVFFGRELYGMIRESSPPTPKGDPCAFLGINPDTKPTNLASVIIRIDFAGRRFLFPGDAGISSLEDIKDYKEKLADVYFLKVPHHGSARNINQELITLMNPAVAYCSGGHHESPEVIACLRKGGRKVESTNESDGDLRWPELPN